MSNKQPHTFRVTKSAPVKKTDYNTYVPKKTHRKTIASTLILLGILLLCAGYGVKSFFDKYEFVSPVQERMEKPQPTSKPSLTPTPSPIEPQAVKQAPKKPIAIVPVAHAETIDYKAFIYQHESGNDPTEINSSGCVGLGQACPHGALPQLMAHCPDNLYDYACQDDFFSNVYLKNRYQGSWEVAYKFGMSKGTPGRNGGWGWW